MGNERWKVNADKYADGEKERGRGRDESARNEWNRQKEADQAAAYNFALSESSLTLEAYRLLLR